MNVNKIGFQSQSTSFNGAYGRIDGKLINLMGKTSDNIESLVSADKRNNGGLSLTISHAFEPLTEKMLKPIELILTGAEKKMYEVKPKTYVVFPSPQIDRNFIIESLFGERIKVFKSTNVIKSVDTPAAQSAQNVKMTIEKGDGCSFIKSA